MHSSVQVIEAGYKIKVGIVNDAIHGVDTESQLIELNELIGVSLKQPYYVPQTRCT